MEDTRTTSLNTMQTLNLQPMEFGDMLSSCRSECGMTQWKAAQASGIDISMISKLERGDFSQMAKLDMQSCHQVIQNLCTAYKVDSQLFISAFDREFAIFQAKQFNRHMEGDDLENTILLPQQRENHRLSAYAISALIMLIIGLAITGFFYKHWVNANKPQLVIPDLTTFAPPPTLPIPVQEIPRN